VGDEGWWGRAGRRHVADLRHAVRRRRHTSEKDTTLAQFSGANFSTLWLYLFPQKSMGQLASKRLGQPDTFIMQIDATFSYNRLQGVTAVRVRLGWLSNLIVPRSKSVLSGAFVCTPKALNRNGDFRRGQLWQQLMRNASTNFTSELVLPSSSADTFHLRGLLSNTWQAQARERAAGGAGGLARAPVGPSPTTIWRLASSILSACPPACAPLAE
jgi:hypothetical protein